MYFDDEAIFTGRQSLAWMIQRIFSNSHQNCSKIVSVDEIMGNKMYVTIGQRISRLGQNRWKNRICSPLYCNAAFFSMRGNLKTRLHCIIKFYLLLCSWLQAVVIESPQETKYTAFVLRFFLGYFLTIPNSQNMFFSLWIMTNLYQQHMQMNELWAVCVMTEESLKRYPACGLVPFPADQKGGIFDFILN